MFQISLSTGSFRFCEWKDQGGSFLGNITADVTRLLLLHLTFGMYFIDKYYLVIFI